MWSSLKLRLPGNASSLTRIKTILNMGRLQPNLTLDFGQTKIDFLDLFHFLQVLPPSIQKLSLEGLDPLSCPPIHVLVEELVAKLLKFEEVYFDCFSLLVN